MEPVVIKARDGLELVSVPDLAGRRPRRRNFPLVLNVHGGPWARDGWGYDPEAQWFANRGYAALQVNFRGSTGFGKKFLNAGNGEWGVGTMQHDLTDAVKWAIAKGIADPKKVCIYGGSYGGYATLAGLDVHAGALRVRRRHRRSVQHQDAASASIPPYWAPIKKEFLCASATWRPTRRSTRRSRRCSTSTRSACR